jgi:hypothetical protein
MLSKLLKYLAIVIVAVIADFLAIYMGYINVFEALILLGILSVILVCQLAIFVFAKRKSIRDQR